MSHPSLRSRRSDRHAADLAAGSRPTYIEVDESSNSGSEYGSGTELRTRLRAIPLTRTRARELATQLPPDQAPTVIDLPGPYHSPVRISPAKRKHSSISPRRKNSKQAVVELPKRPRSSSSASSDDNVPLITRSNVMTQIDVPAQLKKPRYPPWSTLPYDIVVKIMYYVNLDAREAIQQDSKRTTWLATVARRVCKSFAEPTLTALYRDINPSGTSELDSLFRLYDKFAGQLHDSTFNYPAKIRSLSLNLSHCGPKDVHWLPDLVQRLPMLSTLTMVATMHVKSWPNADRVATEVFRILREHKDIRLSHFTWSHQLLLQHDFRPLPDEQTVELMTATFLSPAFQSLRTLYVGEYDRRTLKSKESSSMDALMTLIALLPDLEALEVVDEPSLRVSHLQSLPQQLKALDLAELHWCTHDLAQLLTSPNMSTLERLDIDRMRMDFEPSFLSVLRKACPCLSSVYIDFGVDRGGPYRYKSLAEEDTPTWPASLQRLTLRHLPLEDSQSARILFQSLVDAAPSLPSLRYLKIETHVNSPWRERRVFDSHWTDRMQRVFKRRPATGCPIAQSIQRGAQHKMDAARNVRQKAQYGSVSTRRSRRIASNEHEYSNMNRQAFSDSEDEAEVNETSEEDEYIHGQCHVVDIRIDNLRPRGPQLTEADFLDSEVSGDEDWTAENDLAAQQAEEAW